MVADPLPGAFFAHAPAPTPVSHAGDSSDLVVGIVGRLAPWKGQHVFLDAFLARVPARRRPRG
ncbi:MAG: hypothetical protein U0W40_00595 [Acidimicrobiia bacterium]